MFHLRVGNNAEFFQIVFNPQVLILERLLPDDDIEVEPPLRHAAGGRRGAIALRVKKQVAVRLRLGIKPGRHQRRRAAEGFPLFPSFQREAECRPRAAHAGGVNGQGVEEIGLDFTEHLERLDDFDGRARRIQVERLAQTVNGVDVHARHRGRAQVKGNAVRFLVLQGEANSLA